MTVVIETGGAQILPPVGDERATVSAWAAHLAADADLRAKSPEYAALAASLFITTEHMAAQAKGRIVRHNHFTRDIKPQGKCPACDRYHATRTVEILKATAPRAETK